MFGSESFETLTQTNAKLVEQVGELVQVERQRGQLEARCKELENTVAENKKELRDLASEKFALEQEVKLGAAQRTFARKRFIVKAVCIISGVCTS